jgi:hypothetical protein
VGMHLFRCFALVWLFVLDPIVSNQNIPLETAFSLVYHLSLQTFFGGDHTSQLVIYSAQQFHVTDL